jgi:hypothetical protein
MNGYICFYLGKRIEVHADTTYQAQQLALEKFQSMQHRRKVRTWDIEVVLAERDGAQVTHDAAVTA